MFLEYLSCRWKMTTKTWSLFAPLSPKIDKIVKNRKNSNNTFFVRRRFKLRIRGLKLLIRGNKLRIRRIFIYFVSVFFLGGIFEFCIFRLQWTISSEKPSKDILRTSKLLCISRPSISCKGARCLWHPAQQPSKREARQEQVSDKEPSSSEARGFMIHQVTRATKHPSPTLKTLTSLNKESFDGDNSVWSFPSVSSPCDYSIWIGGPEHY